MTVAPSQEWDPWAYGFSVSVFCDFHQPAREAQVVAHPKALAAAPTVRDEEKHGVVPFGWLRLAATERSGCGR